MARLTAAQRKRLPDSDFADPKHRKYPIEDRSRAENADSRVANKSPATRAMVHKAVHRRYKDLPRPPKKKHKKTAGRHSAHDLRAAA